MASRYSELSERPIKDSFDARRFFIDIHRKNMPDLQSGLVETRSRRVAAEIRTMMRVDPIATDFVTCAPLPGSNCQQFVCSVLGPESSPYELGIFHLMLVVTERYPHEPPYCRFLTKVYHPDITLDGRFDCCDILEGGWCPALTFKSILMTITSMLTEVSPCEPLVPEAAATLAQDANLYESIASSNTRQYATKPPPSVEEAKAVGSAMLEQYADRWASIQRAIGR